MCNIVYEHEDWALVVERGGPSLASILAPLLEHDSILSFPNLAHALASFAYCYQYYGVAHVDYKTMVMECTFGMFRVLLGLKQANVVHGNICPVAISLIYA